MQGISPGIWGGLPTFWQRFNSGRASRRLGRNADLTRGLWLPRPTSAVYTSFMRDTKPDRIPRPEGATGPGLATNCVNSCNTTSRVAPVTRYRAKTRSRQTSGVGVSATYSAAGGLCHEADGKTRRRIRRGI